MWNYWSWNQGKSKVLNRFKLLSLIDLYLLVSTFLDTLDRGNILLVVYCWIKISWVELNCLVVSIKRHLSIWSFLHWPNLSLMVSLVHTTLVGLIFIFLLDWNLMNFLLLAIPYFPQHLHYTRFSYQTSSSS